MKRYHELASVYKNDERIGYVLFDTEKKVNKFVYHDEFMKLVELCEVQYFIKTDLGLQIALTDEEIKKVGKLFGSNYTDMDEYFRVDKTVSFELFEAVQNNPEVILGLISAPVKMPVLETVFPIHLVSTIGVSSFIKKFEEQYRNSPPIIWDSDQGPVFLWTANIFSMADKIFEGMLIDTNILYRKDVDTVISDSKKRLKIHNPIILNPNKNAISNGISFFNGITQKTLDTLNK